jgi:lycopene cyclase domain-containing protein
VYLLALLVALSGLAFIDWRLKLAFFLDWKRAAKTLAVAVAVFVVWDQIGIHLHIFFIGHTQYLTGLNIWPQFPIEELFFLSLLCYTALILWRVVEEKWPPHI